MDYQYIKSPAYRYKLKRRNQLKMYFELADRYEGGKISADRVLLLLGRIKRYEIKALPPLLSSKTSAERAESIVKK